MNHRGTGARSLPILLCASVPRWFNAAPFALWRSLILLATLLTGCQERDRSPPRQAASPPSRALAGRVLWDVRVTEYRRTQLWGPVAALFRNDAVEGREAATGRRLWRVTGELEGRPAADGDRGFLPLRLCSRDLRVVAHDRQSGARRWRSPNLLAGARSGLLPRPSLGGSWVAAGEGRVVVAVRGWYPEDSHEARPRRVNGLLVCLDAADGHALWQQPFVDPTPDIDLQPVILTGAVVLPDGEALVARELASGEERWRRVSLPPSELRAAEGGRLLALVMTEGGWRLTCLASADGQRAWQRDFSAATRERQLVAAGSRVLLQYDRAGTRGPAGIATVVAANLAEGTPQWEVTPDPGLERQVSWPIALAAVPGGRLAAAYQLSVPTGYPLYLLAPQSGATAWRWTAPESLQEALPTAEGPLLLHLSGYGRGQDRLVLLQPPP